MSAFEEAYQIESDPRKMAGLITLGFVLSLLKTKYIFVPACRRNLKRIASLAHPRIWEFYRPGFFLFLITMISLGAWLSRMAAGNYLFLISVDVIDMALSLALLFSGFVFFREQEDKLS